MTTTEWFVLNGQTYFKEMPRFMDVRAQHYTHGTRAFRIARLATLLGTEVCRGAIKNRTRKAGHE